MLKLFAKSLLCIVGFLLAACLCTAVFGQSSDPPSLRAPQTLAQTTPANADSVTLPVPLTDEARARDRIAGQGHAYVSPPEPVTPELVAAARAGGGLGGLGVWLQAHWGAVLFVALGIFEIIVRVTPSERDNSIFNFLKSLLDKLLPNAKVGGGLHA